MVEFAQEIGEDYKKELPATTSELETLASSQVIVRAFESAQNHFKVKDPAEELQTIYNWAVFDKQDIGIPGESELKNFYRKFETFMGDLSERSDYEARLAQLDKTNPDHLTEEKVELMSLLAQQNQRWAQSFFKANKENNEIAQAGIRKIYQVAKVLRNDENRIGRSMVDFLCGCRSQAGGELALSKDYHVFHLDISDPDDFTEVSELDVLSGVDYLIVSKNGKKVVGVDSKSESFSSPNVITTEPVLEYLPGPSKKYKARTEEMIMSKLAKHGNVVEIRTDDVDYVKIAMPTSTSVVSESGRPSVELAGKVQDFFKELAHMTDPKKNSKKVKSVDELIKTFEELGKDESITPEDLAKIAELLESTLVENDREDGDKIPEE